LHSSNTLPYSHFLSSLLLHTRARRVSWTLLTSHSRMPALPSTNELAALRTSLQDAVGLLSFLDDLDLTMIVGNTGSGKRTIANILAGFVLIFYDNPLSGGANSARSDQPCVQDRT